MRHIEPPKEYVHQGLINHLNDTLIASKIHLGLVQTSPEQLARLKERNPIPTVEELDQLQAAITRVLRKETLQIRY